MIAYSLAVLAGVIVDAWLLALVVLRGRRRWLQAAFAALALTFIVNGAAFAGTSEGLLAASWESAVLWTLVLSYPLTAILVLSLLHGETVPRRRPAVFALLAFAPVVVLLTPSADWAVAHAYEPNLLGAFLIVCLGVALAEAVYQRLTSVLFAGDAFALAAGVVALLIGGPIYALEFQDLGILQSAGSNLAAPAALAAFAVVLFHADPFPGLSRRGVARNHAPQGMAAGLTVVFDEARPKLALEAARRLAAKDVPVLLLAREEPTPLPETADFARLSPTRHAAARMLASVSEFCARCPGGLAVLPDLADVSAASGWPRTQEAVLRLRGVVRDTSSRLVVSAADLVRVERAQLRDSGLTWWELPDPSREFEAALGPAFGTGAGRLVDAFCQAEGLRREDLTFAHAEPFLAFLDRALAELGDSAADAAARRGLRSQAEAAAASLRAFVARDAADLASGDWPSRRPSEADRGLLVTAADHWKGREMEELFTAASDIGERESVFKQARAVFVEQLGDAGEGMLRSELAKLGRTPGDLRPEDITKLADRAAVDLAALAEVVDVPQERIRIQGQVESIRRRLAAIAGEEP